MCKTYQSTVLPHQCPPVGFKTTQLILKPSSRFWSCPACPSQFQSHPPSRFQSRTLPFTGHELGKPVLEQAARLRNWTALVVNQALTYIPPHSRKFSPGNFFCKSSLLVVCEIFAWFIFAYIHRFGEIKFQGSFLAYLSNLMGKLFNKQIFAG